MALAAAAQQTLGNLVCQGVTMALCTLATMSAADWSLLVLMQKWRKRSSSSAISSSRTNHGLLVSTKGIMVCGG